MKYQEEEEHLSDEEVEKKSPKRKGRKPKKQTKTSHAKEEEEQESKILERGHIYFFYKPKVNKEEVDSFQDVQRLFVVLAPNVETKKGDKIVDKTAGKKRAIIIPKKKLPSIDRHARYWGIIETVTDDIKVLDDLLNAKHYETKTKGEQVVEGARPAGEGIYAIVYHHGHTHLAYVLEIPDEEHMGQVQKAFNITKEGSFVINVKNPDKPRPSFGPQYKSKDKPDYPSELKKHFQNYSFVSANPVELMDYPGAELIIIGAKKSLKEEFGETGEFLEELQKKEVKYLHDDDLFKELNLKKSEHPPEPLLQGDWK